MEARRCSTFPKTRQLKEPVLTSRMSAAYSVRVRLVPLRTGMREQKYPAAVRRTSPHLGVAGNDGSARVVALALQNLEELVGDFPGGRL